MLQGDWFGSLGLKKSFDGDFYLLRTLFHYGVIVADKCNCYSLGASPAVTPFLNALGMGGRVNEAAEFYREREDYDSKTKSFGMFGDVYGDLVVVFDRYQLVDFKTDSNAMLRKLQGYIPKYSSRQALADTLGSTEGSCFKQLLEEAKSVDRIIDPDAGGMHTEYYTTPPPMVSNPNVWKLGQRMNERDYLQLQGPAVLVLRFHLPLNACSATLPAGHTPRNGWHQINENDYTAGIRALNCRVVEVCRSLTTETPLLDVLRALVCSFLGFRDISSDTLCPSRTGFECEVAMAKSFSVAPITPPFRCLLHAKPVLECECERAHILAQVGFQSLLSLLCIPCRTTIGARQHLMELARKERLKELLVYERMLLNTCRTPMQRTLLQTLVKLGRAPETLDDIFELESVGDRSKRRKFYQP